jgi:hypothetical protein
MNEGGHLPIRKRDGTSPFNEKLRDVNGRMFAGQPSAPIAPEALCVDSAYPCAPTI